MILVFGSGKNTGVASIAQQHFGASAAEGKSGFCYAIPVWLNNHLVKLDDVASSIRALIDFAKENPGIKFYMTRVACDDGEYRDDQIAPLFIDAPENITIPGVWLNEIRSIIKKPQISRIVVTGPRNFIDYPLMAANIDFYISRLNMESIEIISGGDVGVDAMGAKYAVERGVAISSPHLDIEKFGRAVGYAFCNHLLAIYATHVLAFHDSRSLVIKSLIDVSMKAGLKVAVVNI